MRTVKAIENDFNVVHDALPAYYFYECREWLLQKAFTVGSRA